MADNAEKKGIAGDGSTLAAVLEKKSETIGYEVQEEEKLPGSRLRVKFRVQEDDFERRLNETLKEFSRQVSIPGFRPGKAPRQLVRKSFEPQAREETVKRLIPRLTEQFAMEKNHTVLTQPYLLEWQSTREEGTTLELALEVRPDIAITDELLGDLKVTAHSIKLDESYVDHALTQLREKNAEYEPTEEGYQRADGLLFDCEVRDGEGNPIGDRCAAGYYSTRVEEELPDEVAAALLEKKKGDVVEMEILEDSEFRPGQKDKVHYRVEVLEVKRRSLPNLDDDFAQDVNEKFETLADLRKGIEEDAQAQEESRRREEALNAIYGELGRRIDFDLPRALVEDTTHRSIGDMERRLNQHGMSLQHMDAQLVRNYAASMKEQAKINVKNQLLMDALAKHMAVEPTEEQVSEALGKIAERMGRKPLAVRARLEKDKKWDEFLHDLTLKITNDRLLEMAQVEYKETTIEEYEAEQQRKQEERAAMLRGEAIAAAEAEKADAPAETDS